MRTKSGFVRSFLLFALIYAALASLLFWVVKDDWRRTAVSTDPVNRDALLPELGPGSEIIQTFSVAADQPGFITVCANLQPGAKEEDTIRATVLSGGEPLMTRVFRYADLGPDGTLQIPAEEASWPAKGA